MEIISVTLKNFKAHRDRQFEFKPGTNAICGENGAGKTSILEAIGWTLFNYSSSYTKDDLIFNGAASAQATVSFVSSRDSRTYDVQRCTSRGYTLYDPQLGQRLPYTRIESEVLPWLRQHLGLSPTTSLEQLFKNTIGVPQGTFTADFQLPVEKRKQVFDTVLKVGEYKQLYSQLASLKRYGEGQVQLVAQAIAQYDETLAGLEALQQQHQQLVESIDAGETRCQALETQLTALTQEQSQLAQQAEVLNQHRIHLQTLGTQLDGKRREVAIQTAAVARSHQAQLQCRQHHAGYSAFLAAEAALQQLDAQLGQQTDLLQARQGQQNALAAADTALATVKAKLEQMEQAGQEIAQLQPRLERQTALENTQTQLDRQQRQQQQQRQDYDRLGREKARLRTDSMALAKTIAQLDELVPALETIPDLESQRDRLRTQIGRVDAAKQFEADLRQLVTRCSQQQQQYQGEASTALTVLRELQQAAPLLASDAVEAALATLESGIALNASVIQSLDDILSDVAQQTSTETLSAQLKAITTTLDQAYRDRARYATRGDACDRQQQLSQAMTALTEQVTQLEAALQDETNVTQQLQETQAALQALDNPRARVALLTQQQRQQPRLAQTHEQQKVAREEIQTAIATIDEQLVQFADLRSQRQAQAQTRDTHRESHMVYLQQQPESQQMESHRTALIAVETDVAQLEQSQQQQQQQYETAKTTYDAERRQQVETDVRQLRSEADRLQGQLPQQRQRLSELEQRLTQLQDVAQTCDRAKVDLKQKERLKRFINFARKVYKEAGPRITERYVYTISQEANRLFRELLNRPNVALEWTRDYDIVVQEGAHRRRFINLSGGEQMCAALAVRLALLRVLADIDIAFFDEPTTNMDRRRRQGLAEAIANIKSFRQLFVISHDDTFEQFTEHIVFVERE
ncbi:MAG: SMC family ATPase [Elainellaceae cyanobacterium]